MLDIAFIRENTGLVEKACKDKKMPADLKRLLELNEALRGYARQTDDMRARRNALAKSSGKGQSLTPEAMEEGRRLKAELSEVEAAQKIAKDEFDKIMLTVPSPPANHVPIGAGEEDNVELRRVGDIPVFDFKPKDHMELMEHHNMIDVPRGVKIAGSRSYFLKNQAVVLEMAITRLTLDLLISRGFTPMTVPHLVKHSAMQGTGYFPIGYDQAYKLPEDELYLIGTSEVSLVSCYMDETLSLEELPLRLAGISTCYRREAGTYGKDTRGLYRVHQFQKVEQVIICEAEDDVSDKLHNEILSNTESILQALELPYRVCEACTAELGIGQTRKNEVESWMPSREAYCETHSCSSFRDFQARRVNIRYKDGNGKSRFTYTLNNTAIASPRILIPFLEVHQNEDMSIRVPKALRPYLNGLETI